MWGYLFTLYAPITANENLSNKPYLYLSLSANLADLLRLVDTRSIILGFFGLVLYSKYPLSLLQYGILLGALDGF